MTNEKLKDILLKHKKWLLGEQDGEQTGQEKNCG